MTSDSDFDSVGFLQDELNNLFGCQLRCVLKTVDDTQRHDL